jgi:hypothetical protein
MKFWERSNIYAIVIVGKQITNDTLSIVENNITAWRVADLSKAQQKDSPSSNQIRSGKDVNNTQLDKYKRISTTTDLNGNGVIFINDLKPGTIYELYVTASSIIPYEPTFLWSDQKVLKL